MTKYNKRNRRSQRVLAAAAFVTAMAGTLWAAPTPVASPDAQLGFQVAQAVGWYPSGTAQLGATLASVPWVTPSMAYGFAAW